MLSDGQQKFSLLTSWKLPSDVETRELYVRHDFNDIKHNCAIYSTLMPFKYIRWTQIVTRERHNVWIILIMRLEKNSVIRNIVSLILLKKSTFRYYDTYRKQLCVRKLCDFSIVFNGYDFKKRKTIRWNDTV